MLKEILKNQPARFKNYAELTIMKTLEAHKDSHKEVGEFSLLKVVSAGSPAGLCPQVVRAAEEAASTLAGSIHSEQCIKVLCPIVQTADYPINLAAIKMQTKVIERIPKEALVQLLPDIIPGLLQVSGWRLHHAWRWNPQTFWVEAQRLRARRSSPPETLVWSASTLALVWICLHALCRPGGSSHAPADPSYVCALVHGRARTVPDAVCVSAGL